MVSKGKVYNQIIDVSKMISTDLIVMGTTGSPKEGFKSLLDQMLSVLLDLLSVQ